MTKTNIRKNEISQAWRIIRAMQQGSIPNGICTIIRISCYLKPYEIKKHLGRFNYHTDQIRKFKPPFPLNWLPIPAPNYFYLIDIDLERIDDLANTCNDFLMFEAAFVSRSHINKIRQQLADSDKTLHEDSAIWQKWNWQFFMVGFDFDPPNLSDGVIQVWRGNSVPDFLKVYF